MTEIQRKPRKPKSPPTPSRPLGESVADVKKLYSEYSHGSFTRTEIASKFGISATSGGFAGRLFTLREFGLLVQNGNEYIVSDVFLTLNSSNSSDHTFKQAALQAIQSSDTFRELLEGFNNKLPSQDAIASRLETQKRFNRDVAKKAASVLEKSLRYAGVLDNSGNILPVRAISGTSGVGGGGGEREPEASTKGRGAVVEPPSLDTLSLEIPVGEDRKVLIKYPRDLTPAEATKVGNVLNAVVA